MDNLSAEYLPDIDFFAPTNTPADDGTCATGMADYGDLTWLEGLRAFPFFDMRDEGERGGSARKRLREEDAGDYAAAEGQSGLGYDANKKRRFLYS